MCSHKIIQNTLKYKCILKTDYCYSEKLETFHLLTHCLINAINLLFHFPAALQKLCKQLHDKVTMLEEEVYDWEVKIRKQDFEVRTYFSTFCIFNILAYQMFFR